MRLSDAYVLDENLGVSIHESRASAMAGPSNPNDDRPRSGRLTENAARSSIQDVRTAVLQVVCELVVELHPKLIDPRLVRLDSDLDRDLALDSLSRAELLLRLDRKFKVQLPDRMIGEADCPNDLVTAILAAGPLIPEAAAIPRPSATTLQSVDEPVGSKTLIDVLAAHAQAHGDREHILLWRGALPAQPITYRDLYQSALLAAGGLIERGVHPGERVAIMLPTGRDFFVAFFGALSAGAVPVPIYPPYRLSQIEDHLHRQAGILADARASILVTGGEILPSAICCLDLLPACGAS